MSEPGPIGSDFHRIRGRRRENAAKKKTKIFRVDPCGDAAGVGSFLQPDGAEPGSGSRGSGGASGPENGVEEILSRFPEEKLTEVFRDGDGEVQSVEVQISAVNRMKTEITERILRNLQEAGKAELLIPIGSLMRSGILSGRGPTLRCRFLPEGSVSARISTRFEACGVNQTRHQLLLSLEVQCCAILGRQQVEVTEPGEYVLAETVLVGRVPESYTQVITEEREVIRDLND